MTSLKLVSLDDAVVFPGMPVTLPVDVGNDTRVLLVPRRGSGYAKVGVVAEVSERVAVGGRGVASLMALHRGVPGAAHTDPDGVLRVEVDERPDVAPPPSLTRELEREYRAVVEEILELRGDDGRISAFVRSITDPGALADTAGYSPDLNFEPEARAARNARRRRAADAGAAASSRSGSPSCASASAFATTWSRARRSSSASISCAGRWTRSARSSARTTARSPRNTARRLRPPAMPEAVQQQAERELVAIRADGRLERRSRR